MQRVAVHKMSIAFLFFANAQTPEHKMAMEITPVLVFRAWDLRVLISGLLERVAEALKPSMFLPSNTGWMACGARVKKQIGLPCGW